MARWNGAAARLNQAADDFFAETIAIKRPGAASPYSKGVGEPTLIKRLQGIVSEGEGTNPADGQTVGDRNFNRLLMAGAIEVSFMRAGFASRDEWPKEKDILVVETGPRTGQEFEAVTGASDDGDRVNAPVIRRN